MTAGGSNQNRASPSASRTIGVPVLLLCCSFLLCEICFLDRQTKMREVNFSAPEISKQEKVRLYNRIYREQHSAVVDCKCGGRFKEISKYTHCRSKRHEDFLQKKSNGLVANQCGTDDIGGGGLTFAVSGSEGNTG